MALKRGSAPTLPTGAVEEVPDEIPRGRGGRPKIRALVDGAESTTHFTTYTRASTLGKALESDYGIQQWAKRMIVHGLSRRNDLVMRAAAVKTTTEDADKGELADIAEAALEAAKATAGATRGTALHALSERVDAGEDMSWLPPDVLAALGRYRELMAPLRVIASETFVVCDALETAGTFDRIVELAAPLAVASDEGAIPAGTRLVLDLKTNKSAEYFGPTYAAQQTVYAHGVPYTHRAGRGTWPDDRPPSREWALILHVPYESPVDAGFYLVDLREGYELAELAVSVRAQTGRDDLFTPVDLASAPSCDCADGAPPAACDVHAAELPTEAPAAPALDLVAELRQAPSIDVLGELFNAHEDVWTDEHTAAARARRDELAADARPDGACSACDQAHPMDLPECPPAEDDVARAVAAARAAKPEGQAKPVPRQVAKALLIAQLRQAPDEAAIDALYDEHTEVWDDDATRMVKARLRELAAAETP